MASIRDPETTDFPSLAKLLVYTQDLHVEAFPDVYKPMSERFALKYLRELAGRDVRIRVADHEGSVAGYTSFEFREIPETAFSHPRRLCYLNQITVDTRYRKQGLGAALISDMCAIASSRGIGRFELDVWGFNDEAKHFFSTQGFQTFGTRMVRQSGT